MALRLSGLQLSYKHPITNTQIHKYVGRKSEAPSGIYRTNINPSFNQTANTALWQGINFT